MAVLPRVRIQVSPEHYVSHGPDGATCAPKIADSVCGPGRMFVHSGLKSPVETGAPLTGNGAPATAAS